MIPLNKPGYIKYICNNDYLNQKFADFKVRITVSARDGLNLVYKHLYKKNGKMNIGVSPFTCFQAILPIIANGHIPVFIDIDPNTFNIDPGQLQKHNIDGLEVIHLGGTPCEMDAIYEWTKTSKSIIIEDCAQALGSTYDGIDVGKFGDYSVFSLIKNIHATIGGLLLSKNDMIEDDIQPLSKIMFYYRTIKNFLEGHCNHHWYNPWNPIYFGLMKLKEEASNNIDTKIRGVDNSLERNLRKSISSIEKLNQMRIKNASYMIERIDTKRYIVQKVPNKAISNRNRLLFRLKEPIAEKVIERLRKNGIAANNLTQNYLSGFQSHISLHNILSKYYDGSKLKQYNSIYNSVIAIPCSGFLTHSEINYIVKKLNQIEI